MLTIGDFNSFWVFLGHPVYYKCSTGIVREAEVILPTFSRDKSILLLNCPLHA